MKPQRVSAPGAGSLIATLPHALADQQRGGCGLLGGALVGALAARGLSALDADLCRDAGRVVRTVESDLGVVRQVEALALRPFLQRRLGIGALGRGRAVELGPPMLAHDRARLVVP